MFVGRSEAGKTTLTQALNGGVLDYRKTQYIGHKSVVIDTPGEYAETHRLGRALALYSYEADVVGLLINAAEPYSLYPPGVTSACNRPCIGIVTKIDSPDADVSRASHWPCRVQEDLPRELLHRRGHMAAAQLSGRAWR